jgi:GH25 family lysozyme M1 (1,4-beta-N-acetylmuramidase)
MKTISLVRRVAGRAFLAAGVLIAGTSTSLAGSVGMAVLVPAVPIAGSAAPAPQQQTLARTADPPADHPELDWAGSQIRAHENTEPDPRGATAPNVGWLRGLDVSAYQPRVDWARVSAAGARFAYIKATEGTAYTNPRFGQQYEGAGRASLIRGAYHFALPNRSSGRVQADFFVSHGGGWSRDGRTLPPMLDMEYNPYGPTCYGLSTVAMADWVRAFGAELHARTGRWPTIYTSTSWWRQCTGGGADFAGVDPLFLARYAQRPGPLPPRWTYWTFWQHGDSGSLPGDQDYFDGSPERLRSLAEG